MRKFALKLSGTAAISLLFVLLMCPLFEAAAADGKELIAKGPAPFTAYPALDSEGFLSPEQTKQEFIHIDRENGQWIYISKDLRVQITRFSGSFKRKNLVWYISRISFKDGQFFRAFMAKPGSPKYQLRPAAIAQNHKVVYAQNGDLFSWRLYNKERSGLIIRDGKLLYENTYTKPVAAVPPLDELALFPDGHVEMNTPGTFTAANYLARGALDVFAFGPILFKDRVKDDRLDKSFTHLEPRSALGVIGPGRFVGILVEGRNKRSVGANLQFVADRLLEEGCYEAFTLDGGQTAAMVFMGEEVMSPGIYSGYQKARKQQDIIGIGFSDQVLLPKKGK